MALSTGPNVGRPETILLRVNRLSDKYQEAIGSGTVTPGDLLRKKSGGQVLRHDQAGKYTRPLVAIEDTFQGRTVDDNYASGELVRYQELQPTDEWWARLAATQFVLPDEQTYLTSNGDGTLKVCGAGDTALAVGTPDANVNAGPAGARCPAVVLSGAGPAGTLGTTTTTSTTTTTGP